ncbi:MAG TPA: hypothetical protein VMH83_15805 [Candidatus Acidoferrum sp.]|nr:hypothetical protein [Candidatus Acidoferrum sp.]
MILAALASFAVAVILGLTLVTLALRQQRGSLPLAVLHAACAVLGLILLIWYINDATESRPAYNLAALLLVLALMGALVLLALRIGKREFRTPPPMVVVVMHAMMGVAALILLVVGYAHSIE